MEQFSILFFFFLVSKGNEILSHATCAFDVYFALKCLLLALLYDVFCYGPKPEKLQYNQLRVCTLKRESTRPMIVPI